MRRYESLNNSETRENYQLWLVKNLLIQRAWYPFDCLGCTIYIRYTVMDRILMYFLLYMLYYMLFGEEIMIVYLWS